MYKNFLAYLMGDKVLHFLYGSVIAMPFIGVASATGGNLLITGILSAMFFGILKEVSDFLSNKFAGGNHGVEFMDIVATTAGGTYAGLNITLIK